MAQPARQRRQMVLAITICGVTKKRVSNRVVSTLFSFRNCITRTILKLVADRESGVYFS